LAGQAITTGTNNTFVGGLAGDGTNDGVNNVAVGTNTLSANCGDSNTGIGALALNLATGTNNTVVGKSAGAGVTSGNTNILIGVNAGNDTTVLTEGDENIFIGASARGSGATVDAETVIGKDVTCTGTGNFTFGNATTDSNIAFGATSITAPSDVRYKEDVETSTAGLSFINDLRPVTYRWKKEKDIPSDHRSYVEGSEARVMRSQGETNHGFIAQEVKEVIDSHSEIQDRFDMWSEDGTEGRQRLGPSALIPILTKAVQELSAEIDKLKA